MSFSIGSSGVGTSGPRSLLEDFGKQSAEGAYYNPRVVRRMLGFLYPYRGRMALAFGFMLAETALTLLVPVLIKQAIDEHIAAQNASGLTQLSLLIAGCFVGLFGASSGQNYLLGWVATRVLADLRVRLFRHLQALHLGYHDTHITGVTVSRVINDVAVINELISQGVVTLIGDFLVLAGIMVVMIQMSPRLALLTFLVLPLMIAATAFFAQKAKAAFRQTRSSVAAVVGELAEDIAGMRAIQAYAQEATSQERFSRANLANREAHIRAMSLSFTFLPTIEFLGMLATAIVLWFGGRAVGAAEVTVGVLVAFLSYVTRFFQPIQELSRLYTILQAAMAGGEQVLALLDTAPQVADAPGVSAMPPISGRIEFDRVSFRYRPDGQPVLKDINLRIEPGQSIALVGPTGAGKTSIVNLIMRFYDASDGAVRIDGIDVRQVSQDSIRRQTGLVPQDPFLFSGTILENIRFGKPEAPSEEVEQAARVANAHGFITALPEDYQTVVLEGGVNLSNGQRQLLCIARAILADPRILILDEATANVDAVTEIAIQEALAKLLAGRTAVIIAHRLSTIRNADWIYVINEGEIVAQGTHANLMMQRGLYTELYERQFVRKR
jgi:ABC-type multidrug transport system fused ATPase/permease subunit